MYYKTNIVLFTTNDIKNELNIWDDSSRKIVAKIQVNNDIINYDINRNLYIIITNKYR